VFWIGEERGSMAPTARGQVDGASSLQRLPFLDISVKNVIPFREQDAECHSLRIIAKVGGVRLGGGMAYNEALLHRFGVFDADGGPGPDVEKVIKSLSRGSLSNLFKPKPDVGASRKGKLTSPFSQIAFLQKSIVQSFRTYFPGSKLFTVS
jgi:hypothetical protein